jgi:putative spermidine/putrescine transport system permease protein
LTPFRPPRPLAVYTFLVCCFSPVAIVVVLLESLTSANFVSFPPVGLSLRWYAQIPQRMEFVASLTTSLAVATVAAIVSTILGTLAGLALVRYRFFGRALLQALFMSPLSVPAIVLGLALLQFYATYGIPRTVLTLALAHVLITSPYTIRLISVSLTAFDSNLERAARSLGAAPWATFRRITMPLIRPGMLAGMVFAFIVSFDDTSVALFLSGATTMTLPVRIFTYVEQSFDPFVTAISSVLILIIFVLALVIEKTIGIGKLFGVR